MGGHNGGSQWDAEPGRAAKADCFALEKGMCTVIEGSFDDDDCDLTGADVKTGEGGLGGWGGYASTAGKAVMVNLWPTSGTGTAESPYTISSAEEWNAFAANVTCGTTYSGKHVKLTADISVTLMAGYSVTSSFQGTFDGDGHTLTFKKSGWTVNFAAPFRYVGGTATIKNLTVGGTITSDEQYAAALVGFSKGTCSIEKCMATATVPWERLLAAAAAAPVASATASTPWPTDRAPRTSTWLAAMECRSVTFIAYREGYTFTYKASAGTLSGTGNPYKLTMPAMDVTINVLWNPSGLLGEGTETSPYQINNADDWNTFAGYVNSGFGFKDKFVQLTADIDITTMAGMENCTFYGTFDGGGHTLNVSYTTDEQYAAPFRYTYGASIKNLKTTGTITTSSTHAGGVVGRNGSSTRACRTPSHTYQVVHQVSLSPSPTATTPTCCSLRRARRHTCSWARTTRCTIRCQVPASVPSAPTSRLAATGARAASPASRPST